MQQPHSGSLSERFKRALTLAQAGELDKALSILSALNLARPSTPEILFQIGRVQRMAGRIEAAETALRSALKLRPAEAAIWQALHDVLEGGARKALEREAKAARIPLGTEAELAPVFAMLEKGQIEQAEAQALALVKQAPGAVWPALALGEVRMARRAWGAALGPLEKAVERAPDLARAATALGETLMQLDQPARAERLLLGVAETDARARLALARLYRRTLRPEEAAATLRTLSGSRASAEELALALADLGDGPGAREAAVRARSKPEERRVLFHRIADGLQTSGAIDEAEATVEAALAEAPDQPNLLTHRAQFRQSAGDLAGAEADLATAIARDRVAAEACRSYANGRKVAPDDPLGAEILSRAARPGLPSHARRVLHFAAAKVALDIGQPDAFEHLRTANRLMAEAFPYDFEADLAEARRLVADAEALKLLDVSGAPRDRILFVTGLPRSGTTLVETILSAHPEVAAGGEMPFLARASASVFELLRQGRADAGTFATAGARYLRAARRRTGTNGVFTDKAISTFSRAGHVLATLPEARIVILRRDPRDVGLSLFRNLFPEGLHRYAYDLEQMGRYIRLHDALVSFWADQEPERVHIIDYEALTAEPERHIRDLVAFCGLKWDPACLAPERSGRRVETLSFAQVRAPIGRHAVEGWRRHEADLAPLIRALNETRIDLSA